MEITFIDEQHLLTEEKLNEIADLLDFAGDYLKLSPDTEMSVTFMNNAEIREINRDYRNKDQATDVISFALEDEGEGELAIVHSFDRELGFLAVHGFLHLNGYDHMTPEDEKEMFTLQEDILTAYGLKR